MNQRKLLNFSVLLSVVCPISVLASGGVLEINQTCAEMTGCFPGDAPGFPVTIDGNAGRSYRLTSDLSISDPNQSGIFLEPGTSNVSIDLAGFEIAGPIVCTWVYPDVVCTPVGTGYGVGGNSSSENYVGISVRNGTVRGMGASGVRVGRQGEVRGVRAIGNRVAGISAYLDSVVIGNLAESNGSVGISASYCVVENNTSSRNGSYGISASASRIAGNIVRSNRNDGIAAYGGSVVSGNTTISNQSDGISASSGTLVIGNTARFNDGYGLNLGSTSSYRENNITSNDLGPVLGGISRSDNFCAGAGTVSAFCP